MRNKSKILTFGKLPRMYGGRHEAGIGVASFEIICSFAENNDKYINYYAAIDYANKNKIIRNVIVLGFNKLNILYFIFNNLITIFLLFINSIKFSLKFKEKIVTSFFMLIFIEAKIREVKPNVIYYNGATCLLRNNYLVTKYKTNAKIIGKIHGLNVSKNIKTLNSKYFIQENEINRINLNSLFFLSNQIKEEWFSLYGKPSFKVNILLNGFNNILFYPNTSNNIINKQIVLLTVGSISKLKGQFRVLKAINQVDKTKFKYICVGNDAEGLINKMKIFSNKNNINFEYYKYNNQNELRKFYNLSNFMILPSIREGFGLVYIESIACGTPVILPKNLPIVSEPNILFEENSILLDNYYEESIVNILSSISNKTFDREKVANSIKKLSWANIAKDFEYLLTKI